MSSQKRAFILGAGFSYPAGMPLTTELLPLLKKKSEHSEMADWLQGLSERLAWLEQQRDGVSINIEQLFHIANFDIEAYRLRQQLTTVGRGDGPATPWKQAESIEAWLTYLEDDLCEVIFESEEKSIIDPIVRWAEQIGGGDTILTFNYDTLVERSFTKSGKLWNHATGLESDNGIAVCKLHGSIDWIIAHRLTEHTACDLLFDKPNSNQKNKNTGSVEDDCRLWRCKTDQVLKKMDFWP